jgi:hypothetical protein
VSSGIAVLLLGVMLGAPLSRFKPGICICFGIKAVVPGVKRQNRKIILGANSISE